MLNVKLIILFQPGVYYCKLYKIYMISCDRINDIDLLFCGIILLVYLMDLLITYSYIPHCKGCIFM